MMAESKRDTGGVADENGELVQRFATTMHNLGLNRAAEELLDMLRSERWRRWSQGGSSFEFLPGEFDYFLSQQDIQRDEVMVIPDVEVKAKLEEAMDERRTGETGYRRPVAEARAALPDLPGRPLRPFGYTRKEAEVVLDGTDAKPSPRPPLGAKVRRFRNSGGVETQKPDTRERWEKLGASAQRLPDGDLKRLKTLIDEELERRRDDAASPDPQA